MATMERNFLATPSFVVRSEGGGNTITLQAAGEPNGNDYVGWRKINFGLGGVMNAFNGDLSPYNVTPSVSNGSDFSFFSPTDNDHPEDDRQARVYNFLNFVHDNPVHVSRINLRASSENVMPTQIIIKTPNIFTGQLDRQVIDVASKKTAYQYQNAIITIDNVDCYLCRNSIVEFTGGFVSPGASTSLFIDLVIDLYLSLEKGLVENYMLLSTATGMYDAAQQHAENQAAVNNPEVVLKTESDFSQPMTAAEFYLQQKARR